jgi:putative membrane protein
VSAAADPARPYRRWFHGCTLLFTLAVGVSAIHPLYPSDWWLENALAWLLVALLFFTRNAFPFSRVSYTLIFAFLLLHELGAHYTYAEVPYREWFPFLDFTERNHYDRLVHFLFGFLFAYPIREIFLRVVRVRGFWGYYLPLDVTMALSMLYELVEWAAAMAFGGELGMAYLGTQGDVWDAHKDMALASLGALLAMLVIAVVNRARGVDLASEWAASWLDAEPTPLGEVELQRPRDRIQ